MPVPPPPDPPPAGAAAPSPAGVAAIVESLPDGVVLTDRLGTVLLVNAAARSMLAGLAGPPRPGEMLGIPLTSGQVVELDLVRADGRHGVAQMRVATVEVDGEECQLAGLRDVTDLREAERRALSASLHDPLTGLPNRALLVDRLERLIAGRTRHPSGRFALMFMDLDRFKALNDTLGHTVADELLVAFGNRLRRNVRPGDTVARLGGDEFAVLLTDVTSPAGCATAARRVLRMLDAPFRVGRRSIQIRTSIGIALASDRVSDPVVILAEADHALYTAKESGRGTYRLYDERMHVDSTRRLRLQESLEAALGSGGVPLGMEPVVELDGGRVVGYEAAPLWRPEPASQPVERRELRRMAADVGLLGALDQWTIHAVLDLLRDWDGEVPRPARVAVDVAGLHVVDRGIAELLTMRAAATSDALARLRVEVPEAALAADAALAARVVPALVRAGVTVGVDGFGASASSLRTLARLPVSSLKLAAAVVANEEWDVVSAAVALAGSLGLDVAAEGVDEAAWLERLQRLGVRFAQGEAVGAVVPAGRLPGAAPDARA